MQLNYPVKFRTVGNGLTTGTIYPVNINGGITVVWDKDFTASVCWDEDDAIRFITKGSWIVTSSGSTLAISSEVPATEDLAGYEALTYKPIGSLVEAPQSDSFTITLSDVSDKLKRLAEASKAAVEALESVKLAIEDLEE